MSRAKKQHYVPQFLLRKFAVPFKKPHSLWVLDKKENRVWYSSVRNAAHENQFYEHDNGEGERIELEYLMGKIDSIGARIINLILDTGTLKISGEDLVWLSYFVSCQMLRTPLIRNEMENLRQVVIRKWGADVRASADDRTIGEYGPEDAKLGSLMFVCAEVPGIANLLREKVWFLHRAPKEHPFIISDNPTTRHNSMNRYLPGSLGLKIEGIELYMPLSPRYCIHIACPRLAEKLCSTPNLRNECVGAIENRTPIDLQPLNVKFANSLQVRQSERFVFGQKRTHLERPMNMLESDPALRNGRRMTAT